MITSTSREVYEARWPYTCSRPCAFEEKKNRKKKNTKPHRTQKTPRDPQHPGDGDNTETACDETYMYVYMYFYPPLNLELPHFHVSDTCRVSIYLTLPLNTSHTFTHTRPLPYIPGLWKSASYSSRKSVKTTNVTHTLTDRDRLSK